MCIWWRGHSGNASGGVGSVCGSASCAGSVVGGLCESQEVSTRCACHGIFQHCARAHSNSIACTRIQGSTVYLDDSGARFGSHFNSRLERARGQGGTKSLSTGTLDQVGRLNVDNSSRAAKLESYLRWVPPKVQVESWECRVVTSRKAVSEAIVLARGWELTVHTMPSTGRALESLGPGEHSRRLLGWTPLLRTQDSGCWVFRGALRGEQLFAALVSSVDWVVRGTYRTAWVTPRCRCSQAYGWGVDVGPHTRGRSWDRTPLGALVCRVGDADMREP